MKKPEKYREKYPRQFVTLDKATMDKARLIGLEPFKANRHNASLGIRIAVKAYKFNRTDGR